MDVNPCCTALQCLACTASPHNICARLRDIPSAHPKAGFTKSICAPQAHVCPKGTCVYPWRQCSSHVHMRMQACMCASQVRVCTHTNIDPNICAPESNSVHLGTGVHSWRMCSVCACMHPRRTSGMLLRLHVPWTACTSGRPPRRRVSTKHAPRVSACICTLLAALAQETADE